MKQWLAAMAVMAWGLVDAGLADTNELARPRQWTSISGAQILAIFVQVSGDKVELRNRAGERIQIPRAKLSAADQALLDEAFGASAPPAAEEFGAAPAFVLNSSLHTSFHFAGLVWATWLLASDSWMALPVPWP